MRSSSQPSTSSLQRQRGKAAPGSARHLPLKPGAAASRREQLQQPGHVS
jgi:hypothetical protein